MKWTVFLVEGQTEQVFLRQFAELMVTEKGYHIELLKYSSDQLIKVSTRGSPKEDATHLVQIINVQGDDVVISFLTDRVSNMKVKGVTAIYGLRDRYTGSNQKRAVDQADMDLLAAELAKLHKLQIGLTVAVEEIEAWFLSVPTFFQKLHRDLTPQRVNQIVGVNLCTYDTQQLPHPALTLNQVLESVGDRYRKRLDDAERIAAHLDYETLYLDRTSRFAPLCRLVAHLSSALP